MRVLAVDPPNVSVSRLAEAQRLLQDRVEHRGEIAGGGIDDLQYFGGRGLLLTRFDKFSLTLGKLTFQIGYELLGIG
jgi:hypothetical protein